MKSKEQDVSFVILVISRIAVDCERQRHGSDTLVSTSSRASTHGRTPKSARPLQSRYWVDISRDVQSSSTAIGKAPIGRAIARGANVTGMLQAVSL